MAFPKSTTGKKQTPMPGPNSAAYKKIVAAKGKGVKSSASAKGGRKNSRSAGAYSSMKSRQLLVERLKREIWASVLQVNEAIINLALAGNLQAAKALFDFAGVYAIPTAEAEHAPVAAPAQAALPPATDPVDAFFRSIGVPPSCEPEPEAAASDL